MRMKRLRSRQAGRRGVHGMYLLEALIALVVLSIGMFGLLGLLTGALRASGAVAWRSEGLGLAADTLARIATEAPAGVAARYDATSGGAGYRALLAQAARLPGVSSGVNAPEVSIDDTGESRRVRVVMHWQPNGERVHTASIDETLPHP
jgi:Tfp pilus assembly protein PilV